MSPDSHGSESFAERDRRQVQQALDAQRALIPHAVVAFALALPVYIWAASQASNASWMAATLVIFVVNWGAFYLVARWLNRVADIPLVQRSRVQLMGGLLWTVAVWQISALADNAGPARESLLMIAVAGGIICLFFTATTRLALLLVGPLALAPPLAAMLFHPSSHETGVTAWAGSALAFALALMMNQMFRRHFSLAAEREVLMLERAESLRLAETLARAKSDLIEILSHEIRNGLSGVTQVLSAAVGRGGRVAPSREQLGAALTQAQDLMHVLTTTLDSETAESGALVLDRAPFDPVTLLSDLLLLFRHQANAKQLELTLQIDPQLQGKTHGAVHGDASRVRQILSNILSNALKYTVRGRVEVRMSLASARHLSIEIADTGPGLDADELRRAFEPFRRIERTSAGVPGAGLGLSLSRQLADLMGARLSVSSAQGIGSCFALDLDFDPECERETQRAPRLAAANDERSLRVLVAEGDALNAAMLRAMLEQLGHQVVHASSSRRALELSTLFDFDLILVDGQLADLNGPRTASGVRALETVTTRSPIIGVTGGDPEDAMAFMAAGADSVLLKPMTVATVARAIAEARQANRVLVEPLNRQSALC